MRRVRQQCGALAKYRSEAQPAARRPERSEGHAQKNNYQSCLLNLSPTNSCYAQKHYFCSMKKSNTSVLLLVFWLGLLYSTAAQDKFEDYTDDKHGFSLKYPTNWQIIHMHGYIWTARSELMNIKDKFEDMVQISTH
ncbi:MAG: hypothetical protein RML94_02275, partial [Bacteroidia bacterium]|nr:hypothetical protein [Bacteroidia bacterium]